MKAFSNLGILFLFAGIVAVAQGQQASLPASTPYSVVARDGNSQTWERTEYSLSPSGKVIAKARYVKELQSGLNYWIGKEWQPSDPVFQVSADSQHVFANQVQTKVMLSANLAESNSVVITTPDGIVLGTTPVAIGLYDSASGSALILASITNCSGVLVASNEVRYDNAFIGSGISASVVYTLKRGSFSQDVVWNQDIDPADYGFPTNTTRIQIFTAFNSPIPKQAARPLYVEKNPAIRNRMASPDFMDHTIQFGQLTFGPGHAFPAASANRFGGAPIAKEFQAIGGQSYLVESIEYPAIEKQMRSLPLPSVSRSGSGQRRMASSLLAAGLNDIRVQRGRPLTKSFFTVRAGRNMFAERAKEKGIEADYVVLSSGTEPDPLVLQGDTTYFVSGPVDCQDLVIEGGTVVKYPDNTNAYIQVDGNVSCQTASYRPGVFTAADDNSIGESMSGVWSGYTGTIQPGEYASPALYLPNGGEVNGVRILYAQTALAIAGNGAATVSDSQMVACGQGVDWSGNGGLTLNNCLAVDSPWYEHGPPTGSTGSLIIDEIGHRTFDLVNCTVDRWYSLDNSENYDTFEATNCIFSWIGYEDPVGQYRNNTYCGGSDNGYYEFSFDGQESPFGDDPIVDQNSPYQTVGGGSYYLADSTFRGQGTANIGPALLADLAQRTTRPPIVFNGANISLLGVLGPQATRNSTNNPDIGYAYDPLDYLFENSCQLSSNLTFSAGTAAGWTTSVGIQLEAKVTANFAGTATSPDYWVRANTVQESDENGSYGPGGMVSEYSRDNLAGAPTAQATFTRFAMLAGWGNPFRDDYGGLNINLRNCEFWDTGEGGYGVGLNLTNCLFDRTYIGVQSSGSADLNMQNCTMRGRFVLTSHSGSWPASIVNCAFDGVDLSQVDSVTYADYNAFLQGASQIAYPGTHDVTVTNFNWESSWFGDFYLPDNPGQQDGTLCIDAGSTTADQLGLYHFTTQTNQVPETNSVVDIGYHYVATDQYGNPLDSNGDGIPDYLEDANGNGIYDSGDLAAWNVVPDSAVPGSWYSSYGLNPNNPLIGIQDPDFDGLLNQQEYLYGTNPTNSEGFAIWVGIPNGTTSIP